MSLVAIDARKINDFGIGRHLQSMLADLARIGGQHQFVVFLPEHTRLPVAAPHLSAVYARAGSYGLAEHLLLPWLQWRHRATIFHVPHYVLPWFAQPRTIVTIHDIIHLKFPQYLPNRGALIYARVMLRRSFHRATRVLTVSETSKQDLLERFGGDPGRVTVIPNRIDDDFFAARDAAELAEIRRRWNLPERFVLYCGNVKPHKNLDRLLRAFARLRDKPGLADVRLVLVGNAPSRYHALQRLATELGVSDKMLALGHLPRTELAAVYRLASVFAYPSLYEGFGLPPLEAMASGVPVVAASSASLPEVLGDAAVLVHPESEESITDGLMRVLEQTTLAAEMAGRGRERAALYRGDGPTRSLLAVYHDVERELP